MNGDLFKALAHAKNLARGKYLNTGESYTLSLIVSTLYDLGRPTSVDRNWIYLISNLSKSTVDTHIRTLGKQGILRREGDRLFFDYTLVTYEEVPRNGLLNNAEQIRRETA